MGDMLEPSLQMRIEKTGKKRERRCRMKMKNILQGCHYHSDSHTKEQKEIF